MCRIRKAIKEVNKLLKTKKEKHKMCRKMLKNVEKGGKMKRKEKIRSCDSCILGSSKALQELDLYACPFCYDLEKCNEWFELAEYERISLENDLNQFRI